MLFTTLCLWPTCMHICCIMIRTNTESIKVNISSRVAWHGFCVTRTKIKSNKYKQIKSFLFFSNKVHASNLQSSTLQCNGINTIKSAEWEKKQKRNTSREKHKYLHNHTGGRTKSGSFMHLLTRRPVTFWRKPDLICAFIFANWGTTKLTWKKYRCILSCSHHPGKLVQLQQDLWKKSPTYCWEKIKWTHFQLKSLLKSMRCNVVFFSFP